MMESLSGPFGGLGLQCMDAQDVAIDSAERGMNHIFGNEYGGFKKARSILGSHVFSPYLFFHTSNSGQIWYLRKAIIEDYPTLLRARRSEKNSWRTWEVTGINHLTQAAMNGAFLIRLDCCGMSFHSSRVLLRFSIISEGIWDVLEVKECVSLVGFQGFRDLQCGNYFVGWMRVVGDGY